MIGVIADPSEHDVVREFFELFKTPWEFFSEEQKYDVLLCAGNLPSEASAKLIVIYAGRKIECDRDQQIRTLPKSVGGSLLNCCTGQIPIYGNSVRFGEKTKSLLEDTKLLESAAYLDEKEGVLFARIGFNLFEEIRILLTTGQPEANASLATLELHISFLRDLVTGSGISLWEIPPVPDGFRFVACLTHDVDHPSIRQQKLDHTIIGFLLRATLGSCVDAALGRLSIGNAIRNWGAAIRLPFVYFGFAKDFWGDFGSRYLEVEKESPSTFFLISRRDYPGRKLDGPAPAIRAACYQARDLADTISKLRSAGREIALHGIDAWIDGNAAGGELESIRQLTGVTQIGVRMHWLYYDENSPRILEKAGAAYDSTIGYNTTVGYRAGTTQVFKSPQAESLLELPLHAMDTALFYLSYLGLSAKEAKARLRQLAENTADYGGVFTINWHDRSLSPERFWGDCYQDLIAELRRQGAWFATAGDAVAWFQKRRSVRFQTEPSEPGKVTAHVTYDRESVVPGLRLRLHKARASGQTRIGESDRFIDTTVEEPDRSRIPSGIIH